MSNYTAPIRELENASLTPLTPCYFVENEDEGVIEELACHAQGYRAPSKENQDRDLSHWVRFGENLEIFQIPNSGLEIFQIPNSGLESPLRRSDSVLSVSSSSSDEDSEAVGVYTRFESVPFSAAAAELPIRPSAYSQEGSWKDLPTPSDGPARRASAFSRQVESNTLFSGSGLFSVNREAKPHQNPKNELQELCQKNRMSLPSYHSTGQNDGSYSSFVEVIAQKGDRFDRLRSQSFSGGEKKKMELAAAADMIPRVKFFLDHNRSSFGVAPKEPLLKGSSWTSIEGQLTNQIQAVPIPAVPTSPRIALVFYNISDAISPSLREKIGDFTIVMKKGGKDIRPAEVEGAKIFVTAKPTSFLACVLFQALQKNDKVFLVSKRATFSSFLTQALVVDPTLKARFTRVPDISAVEMLL